MVGFHLINIKSSFIKNRYSIFLILCALSKTRDNIRDVLKHVSIQQRFTQDLGAYL